MAPRGWRSVGEERHDRWIHDVGQLRADDVTGVHELDIDVGDVSVSRPFGAHRPFEMCGEHAVDIERPKNVSMEISTVARFT